MVLYYVCIVFYWSSIIKNSRPRRGREVGCRVVRTAILADDGAHGLRTKDKGTIRAL